jgi:hypothetical protein
VSFTLIALRVGSQQVFVVVVVVVVVVYFVIDSVRELLYTPSYPVCLCDDAVSAAYVSNGNMTVNGQLERQRPERQWSSVCY